MREVRRTYARFPDFLDTVSVPASRDRCGFLPTEQVLSRRKQSSPTLDIAASWDATSFPAIDIKSSREETDPAPRWSDLSAKKLNSFAGYKALSRDTCSSSAFHICRTRDKYEFLSHNCSFSSFQLCRLTRESSPLIL